MCNVSKVCFSFILAVFIKNLHIEYHGKANVCIIDLIQYMYNTDILQLKKRFSFTDHYDKKLRINIPNYQLCIVQ